MANHKKKAKTHFPEETDEDFEVSMTEFAEAIIEDINENHMNSSEPFEHYVEKVRAKVHANPGQFRSRLIKGYRALVDELSHQEGKS